MKKTRYTYVTIWAILFALFLGLATAFSVMAMTKFAPAVPTGFVGAPGFEQKEPYAGVIARYNNNFTMCLVSMLLKLGLGIAMFVVLLVLFLKTYNPNTNQKRFYIYTYKVASFVTLAISSVVMCALAILEYLLTIVKTSEPDPFYPNSNVTLYQEINLPLFGIIAAVVAVIVIIAFIIITLVHKWLGAVIIRLDEESANDTAFAKNLLVNVEFLTTYAKSAETKAACKKVYEAIRYCDPTANASIRSFEEVINMKFSDFDYAVKSDNAEKANEIANEIVALTDNRNNKCMLAH